MPKITHLPEPGVILDLDIEERPEEDIKTPFVVKVAGRSITMADPDEIDWRELATVELPTDLLRVSMSKEDRIFLRELNLPTWKFRKFLDSYYDYYDLEDKIRSAKQQSQTGL